MRRTQNRRAELFAVRPSWAAVCHRQRQLDEAQWFRLRFATDGRGEVVGGPFGYANGLALSADERHLYMVESDTDSVLRFEIGADDRLGDPEVYAEGVGRFPDGLALDARRQPVRLLLRIR